MQANDLPTDLRPDARPAWHARLMLEYGHERGRTVLARREHEGPLAVQKSLYPEGGICHNFVLHPPAGIANGDELDIDVRLGHRAHVVLSTPGAGKWYRSAGALAQQQLKFAVGDGAVLEWLPQETIFYSGAIAQLHTRIDLHRNARYLGWEINCLGLSASDSPFAAGRVRQHSEIFTDGRLRWSEQGRICGDDPLLASVVGLGQFSLHATMVAVGAQFDPALIQALRALNSTDRLLAVTLVDNVLVLRHLGHSAQTARNLFAECRKLLRPALCAVEAQSLRIWNT